MAKSVRPVSLVRDVAELMKTNRRLGGAIAASQVPVPAKDRLPIATNGQPATWQLSAIPLLGDLGSSVNLSLNGQELDEATDYTVDYSTGIVTFSAGQQALFKATPAPADVLTVDYWTSDEGIANAQPVDGGLALLSDWTQDQGAWGLDISNKFIVTGAAGGGTRFGGAFNGFYTLIHDNGAATVHFVANTLHNSSADDGFAVAFNPGTGAGYRISWDGGTFHGGIQLYRYTNDTTGAEVANAIGNPIATGSYDAKIEVVYNSSTGVMSVYYDSIASGLTTLRINYTDGTPLTGTWFGAAEYFSNLGAGKWWNWVLQ